MLYIFSDAKVYIYVGVCVCMYVCVYIEINFKPKVVRLIYTCLLPTASFYCVHTQTHTHTHKLAHIQYLSGRPPRLTGLVNHLHNINGETFVTSNARLTQRLFNCPQGTRDVEGVKG